MSSTVPVAVKQFDDKKDYGFIINLDREDAFFHYRSVVTDAYENLPEGHTVQFTQTTTERDWQADEVMPPKARPEVLPDINHVHLST